MSYQYRLGTLDDLQQLKALGLKSYGQYEALLTPENHQKLISNLDRDELYIELFNQATCFVCEALREQNREIVGMAFLVKEGHPTEIFKAHWTYLRMVGVCPKHGGQGIGKQLTHLCIEEAKRQQSKTLALHTSEIMNAARHIYESIGFQLLKEIPRSIGVRYWLYTLELDLP